MFEVLSSSAQEASHLLSRPAALWCGLLHTAVIRTEVCLLRSLSTYNVQRAGRDLIYTPRSSRIVSSSVAA